MLLTSVFNYLCALFNSFTSKRRWHCMHSSFIDEDERFCVYKPDTLRNPITENLSGMAVDITPNQDGGILKEIIKEGVGDLKPVAGNEVFVHYTGYFTDGKKFDSSKDRGEPFSFNLQRSNLIKAWDIGVATMRKSEIAVLTCSPEYAYGKTGMPPVIPPDTLLKFEIELINWKGEDVSPKKDGSILKMQIIPGTGYTDLMDESLVKIHLIGTYNGHEFENREVLFTLGEGGGVGVPEGVEIALQTFVKGEKSRLIIHSKYAFGKEGKAEFNVPGQAIVEYEVELISFSKPLNRIGPLPTDKIAAAKIYKEKGTNYFKANQYKMAITMYKKINTALESQIYEGDVKKEYESLKLSAHLNLALCYLKTDKNSKAKVECNEALKIDPENEKALFRRGQAYLALASPDLALIDFKEALRIEPNNTAAANKVAMCNDLIKKQTDKSRRLYANMFDRFAQEDRQIEEEKMRGEPDVMRGALGVWGQEERAGGRDPTAFEKENPNILMLNADGAGDFQNM